MNLQDYKKRPRFYKIVDERSERYGVVYEARKQINYTNQVELDIGSGYRLSLDHVQEVVPKYEDGEWQPMQLDGEYVCIGDNYSQNKIIDYYWKDDISVVTQFINYLVCNLTPYEHTPMHPTHSAGSEQDTDDIAEQLRNIAEWSRHEDHEGKWTPLHKKMQNRILDLADELEGNQE